MTQASTFISIMKVLEKSDPKAHAVFVDMSMSDIADFVSADLADRVAENNYPSLSDPQEPPFKIRPAKGSQTCYMIAEWNYALNLYTCSLITDPNIRKQCEMDAKISYCEAYDLCGDPA